ncbi:MULTISPECIES: hypothetical protein [unclassified Mesorhizobium]|uniref:hypothetical protein n=1 Tax=unclassified Mesorhizobium TaxID=325217 RepID=UPI000FD84033|nr:MULTISPECIES: hypothetical protein [unclassified Mesorhizobium]TGQ33917.1 hypothetical protein EN859_026070 [Mesorhizobium sp. M00.F.Ca.ET.216.01.1.1]TIS57336.1 MAG: hypothetical protein E5W91_14515 [Mesorhizobium sp.]TIS91649.1 MAG: hypothetical protein E5W89_05580 [Mesorhizobium sp.]TJW10071.1 MAG: hypothetical protein E5W82_20245 [Mesorhizobium sp.]TJW41004.1 MAG: hypothetical protein E5W83_27035 [Mesorhizobium sp.]
MKHQTLDQLHVVADVHAEATDLISSRSHRLERWAKLLEQNPDRRLEALTGTEYKPADIREKMRSAGSPITVAFEDPIFRAQGLKDDTYGEAKRFFELSDWQLHEIVCHCHVGAMLPARWAATRVRAAISGKSGFFAWLRETFLH